MKQCFSSVLVVFLALAPSIMSAQAQQATADSSKSNPRIRIGSGDLLSVTVFDVPELTQEVRVSDGGDASITLIGSMHLDGMTVVEAQTAIAAGYRSRDLVRDPNVSITIKEYVTQGVSVLGEVTNPGVYPVLGSRSLLDIVSAAGGITHSAAHRVTIKRRDGAVLAEDLSTTAGALASNVPVYPGDTIVVEKAGIVYVLGDVGRPGGFEMENQGGITLLEAVAMAGGPNRSASERHARIVRRDPSGLNDIPIDLKDVLHGKSKDVALQAEDIIYVPSSIAKSLLDRTPQMLQSAASSANVYAVVPK